MNITTKDDLREISLPFPSFKPNTLILSEQINDNNDEIQYRTNLLVRSYLKHVEENIGLEDAHDLLRVDFDEYLVNNNERVSNLEAHVDNEVSRLDKSIEDEVNILNNKIDVQDAELNVKITKKGDTLELKNTLLYLKSGESIISTADLSGLGGVAKSTNYLAFGNRFSVSDWVYDEGHDLYYVIVEHGLKTSVPVVTYYDEKTNLNGFDIVELVNANTVKVYTDEPIDTYMVVIDGSGNINIVQAILDDEQITNLRTWSSEKIRREIDNKTVDLSPIENSIRLLQEEVNGQRLRGIEIANSLLEKL